MAKKIKDAIFGLTVGDALGVPIEFTSREQLTKKPVKDMQAHGTFNQPKGSWSDDTSMTLALMDSLANGLDYDDIMKKFILWYKEGKYTPLSEAFGVGISTRQAINNYKEGAAALDSGGKDEYDNGNGSLMRTLPVVFYLRSKYGDYFEKEENAFSIIHNISALTHGHAQSKIACTIYVLVANNLLNNENVEKSIEKSLSTAVDYYQNYQEFSSEIKVFQRLLDPEFKKTKLKDIESSGYVVDTLEAGLWCLLNTDDYKTCVLKAVNLGRDTDTVAAIAGGLAGITYGYDSIPLKWRENIIKKDFIESLCHKYYLSLN